MKNSLLILCLLIVFLGFSTKLSASTAIAAGNVSGSWNSAGSPYLINGNITIAKGTTLTIDAGVSVQFQGHYGLFVEGRLLANGTPGSKITFTAASSTTGWSGIRFNSTLPVNDTSFITSCNILYGKANTGTSEEQSGGGIFVKSFSKLVIRNCIISNCYSSYAGGGIALTTNASPVIINNIFCNNTTISMGGAIWMDVSSNPQIINNTFANNHSNSWTGGVDINGSSTPIIKNCIFWGNTATNTPQIYPGSYANVSYSNVQGGWSGTGNINSDPLFISPSSGSGSGIVGYTANWGINSTSPCKNKGALAVANYLPLIDVDGDLRIDYDTVDIGAQEYIQSDVLCGTIATNRTLSKYVIVSCDVTVNTGYTLTVPAGAKVRFMGPYKLNINGRLLAIGTFDKLIRFYPIATSNPWKGIRFDNTPIANDTSKIEYSIIQNSYASGSGNDSFGGAIFCNNVTKLIIRNNFIVNNRSVSYGGAICCLGSSAPYIVSNLIANNTSYKYGGAIYISSTGNTYIINNTITRNISSYAYGTYGNGIYVKSGSTSPILRNNIIWRNNYSGAPLTYQVYPATGLNVQYCDIEGAIYPGSATNVNTDPLFKSVSAGSGYSYNGLSPNWLLQTSSPLINAGTGGTAATLCSTYNLRYLDSKGRSRVWGTIDMGAFEDMSSINVCGYITQNTTWNATTVHVTCNVTVQSGVTLNIAAGTKVVFDGFYYIRVNGRLLAQGTASDSIKFYAQNPAIGWNGIRFDSMYYQYPNINDTSKFSFCRIENGKAYSLGSWPYYYGGAFFAFGFDKIIIQNSLFTNNTNSGSSYGSSIALYMSSPIIRNCIFTKNSASIGGAIYAYQFNGIIENCKITNNTANNGGGLYLEGYNSSKIINTLIVNNTALNYGGAVYLQSDNPQNFINCTISNNSAQNGGGFTCTNNSDPVIKNCIIWSNNASVGGNEFCLYDVSSDPKIYYSDIEGGPSAFNGAGSGANYAYVYQNNIDINPNYVSPSATDGNTGVSGLLANWRLPQGSPCINSGTSITSGLNLPDLDIEGKTRIYNGRIDIGAYENQEAINACGVIVTDKIWEADTIKVTCDVMIQTGSTLTISPGTYVQFQGPYKLEVQGRLLAIGTESKKITFSINDTNYFSRIDSFNRGGWKGIQFNSVQTSNDSSKLIYCNISYGKAAGTGYQSQKGGGLFIYNTNKLLISNCYISNNLAAYTGSAIYLESSNPRILNSVICNNTVKSISGGYAYYGTVYMDDANPDFINNTVVNNVNPYYGAVYLTSVSSPLISNCIIYNNLGIYAQNYGNYYADFMSDNNCSPTISNCLFTNSGTTYLYYVTNLQNIIYGNPEFVSPSLGRGSNYNGFNADWSLNSNTPCLNAGTASSVSLHLPSDDLAGKQRIIGDTIDIGAYEIQIHNRFISLQPVPVTACVGTRATFSVSASIPVSFQWQKNGINILGATSRLFSINSVVTSDSGYYRCIMSNQNGYITSDSVKLTVRTLPSITSHPNPTNSACLGGSDTFSVTATGSAPLTYQWYNLNGAVSGGSNSSYLINPIVSSSASTYRCIVTNSCSTATSNGATLTINTPVSVSSITSSNSICVGATVSLSTIGSGTAPITYKWYKNGASIGGATNFTYQITNAQTTHSGSYYCKATNVCRSDSTNTSSLTVNAAPSITYQSPDDSICVGQSKTFTISAASSLSASYQWYYPNNTTAISGATNNIYSISSIASSNGGTYYCKATNTCGTATTTPGIVLAVKTAPSISSQTSSLNLCPTQQATFSVTASGTAPITYKWYKDNNLISGATSSTYQINSVITSDAANYYCAVSNSCGSTNSSTKTLTVNTAPTITYQSPKDSVCLGQSKTFNISASGTAPITYQWYKNGTTAADTIPAAKNYFYAVSSVASTNNGDYYCKATNTCGFATTSPGINLVVKTPPSITSQTSNLNYCTTQNAPFGVTATGTAPITYKWYKDNTLISGASNSTYQINSIATTDAANYYCAVTNSCGSTNSTTKTLTVNVAPTITYQSPKDSVCLGLSKTFNITATGSAPITYKWYKGTTNPSDTITGAKNNFHTISSVTSSHGGVYYCIATNTCGSKPTSAIDFTVKTAPSLSSQSSNLSYCTTQNAPFSVTATGTAPITYKWYKDNTLISGANNSTYQINSITTTDAANYYCAISNSCGSINSSTKTLTVNVAPTITYQSRSDSVCLGLSKTFNITATGSSSITYRWYKNGTAASDTIAGAPNTYYTISSVVSSNTGAYYCKATNVCGSATSSAINFVVKTAPSISSQSSNSNTLCPAQLVTFSVTASGSATLIYKWYKDNSLISGANSNSYQINSVATSDAANYYCAISNSCGSTNSSTKSLTINSAPTISFQSGADSVCPTQSKTFTITASGSAPITYQWYKNGTATSDTIAAANNYFYSINSVTSSNGGTYYCKATNGCGFKLTSAINLTVKTPPSISSQSSNQALCPAQQATFSVTASGTTPLTYKWYKDNILISGATSSIYQISSVAASDAANYYCAVSNSCGSTNSSTKTLTVNIAPTITYQSGADSVCPAQSKTFNITASGSSPITYQWYKNGTATSDTIKAANTNSYTISSVASSNGGTYYCKATNGCGFKLTSAINLTVKTAPSISSQSSNQALCPAQQATFSVTAAGTAPLTYKWYKDNVQISGTNSSTYQINSVTASDAANYYCAISNSCGSTNSSTKTLTVNSTPSITYQSRADSVCLGLSKTFNITASGSAPITYQWYKNGTAASDTIAGAPNNYYYISTVASTNGGTYYCKATNSCGSATSSAISFTVKTSPSISSQSSNLALCPTQQAPFSVTATGTAPLTYKWYKDNTLISGATSSSYQINSIATSDAANYYCAITNSCGTANSTTKILTVNTAPNITYQSPKDSVCLGQSKTFNITATGTAPITYQWYKNGTATTDTIAGAYFNSLNISSVASTSGGTYYCKATNGCGSKTTSAIDFIVKTSPSITSQSSNQTLCPGQLATFTVSATGTSPITYKWYKDNIPVTGATSSTYQISSVASSDAANYYCAVTNSCNTTNSSTKTLTVNTAPTISYQSPKDSVCIGQSKTFSITASGSAPITYQWYKNGTATSDTIPGATNYSYTISSVASSNGGTYYCKATNSCGSKTTSAIDLIVKTAPSISSQSSNITLCPTQLATFSVTATGSTPITYKWYKDNNLISGATNSTYQISSVATSDAGNYYCAISNSCSSINSLNKTLTVNIVPSIAYQTASDSVCLGDIKTFSITAIGSTPITYQWYKNGTATADTISGAIYYSYTIGSVASSNGGSYYCKATNSCGTTTSSAINLTVKTAPSLTTQSSNLVLCVNQLATFSVTVTGTAPLTYKWYKDNTLISGANSSTYQISSVSTSDAGNYHCGISNSCGSINSLVKILIVNVAPTIVSQSTSDSICLGKSKMLSISAAGSAPISYQWYFNSTSNAISGATSYFYTINSVNKSDGGLYYCKVTNACGSATTSQIGLFVRTAPVITAQSTSASRCVGQSQNFSITATGVPIPTYQWYKDDTAIVGATNNTYSISVVGVADGGNYYCVVSNSCDDVRSNIKTLTVNSPPDITYQTSNTTKCSGQSIILNVTSTGAEPITYQWYQGSNPINAAVNNFYPINGISAADSGTYYCIATNACGTDKSANISLKVNLPVSVYKQSRDTIKCAGDATLFDIQAYGTLPIKYLWYYNGTPLSADSSSSFYLNSLTKDNIGTYYCKMTNVCGSIDGGYKEVLVRDLPVVHLGNDTTFCLGGNINLGVDGPYYCKWSNGSTKLWITVTHSGNYFVHVTDPYGCKNYSDTVNITVIEPYPNENICVVTVDPITGKNLIAWERTRGYGIAYYNVYKETNQTGVYDKIGSVHFDSLSVFIDYNSNPRKKSDRYAITVIDSCGFNESDYSPFHKSIHLTANKGTSGENNLSWNHYEGFAFSTYQIFRGTHPSNMVPLDFVASNLNSYSDLTPPSGAVYYQVAAMKKDTCYPDITRAQTNSGPYSQSVSNLKDYSQVSTSYITASPLESYIGWRAGSKAIINIYTNLNTWDATTTASWLTLVKDFPNNTINAIASENPYGQPRTDTVKITGGEGIAPQEVVVHQYGTTGIFQLTPEIQLTVYPNPFNYSTNIDYELLKDANVNIEVYNMVGEKVASVINQHQLPGKYNYMFNDAPTDGIYILRIVVNNNIYIKKLIKTH